MNSKNITIIIKDEVHCEIHGLSRNHLLHFYNSYGIYAENYIFNPKYKLGAWDGKIRYFHMDGATYVYLLDEIIPTLAELGYDITFDDRRVTKPVFPEPVTEDIFSHVIFPDSGEPLKLRPHQLKVINALIGNGGGVGIAATGAGKTFITAAIAKVYGEYNFRTMVIVPSQDLVTQTREEFDFVGVENGEYSGSCKQYETEMCVVSTWQALKNAPHIISDFNVVIVDECHGIKGNVLSNLLNEHGRNIVHRFGVTGTLPKGKTDAMAVRIAVGEVQETVTAADLIAAGLLASLNIHVHQLMEDLTSRYDQFMVDNPASKKTYTQFKDAFFPDYTSEKSYLQRNEKRLEWIANKVELARDGGNVFVLVDGVAFGKKLQKMIPDSTFVHGKDKKAARKQIYDHFKENDGLVVIATVNIASTGLNIKRIYNLFLVDIGKSFTRVIQSIGRGLRKAPDKDHVDVYDICSDLKYAKKHLTERTKYYNEAKYPNTKKKVDYAKELADELT
jgi:superfamily II DNA or RNA helicase